MCANVTIWALSCIQTTSVREKKVPSGKPASQSRLCHSLLRHSLSSPRKYPEIQAENSADHC